MVSLSEHRRTQRKETVVPLGRELSVNERNMSHPSPYTTCHFSLAVIGS
jgi:hypothetical protein